MKNYFSLVLFTYLSQAAIGMVFVREFLIISGNISRGSRSVLNSYHIISLLLIISLLAAFFHLGRPQNAIHAVRNITSSPLSMEIASMSMLIFFALLGSISMIYSMPRFVTTPLPSLMVIASFLLLVTMTMVYLLPAVPAWNRPFTPLVFTFTALSAGTAIMSLLMFHHDTAISLRLIAISSLALLIMAVAYITRLSWGEPRLLGITLIISLLTVVALTAFILTVRSSDMNKSFRLVVISAVAIISSGLIARIVFFLSYDNTVL